MKKLILLFVAVCLLASAVIAQPDQLQKGKILTGVTSTLSVSGSWSSELFGLGFYKNSYKEGGTTEESYSSLIYNFLPKGGYFFMDNLAGGLQFVISGRRYKDYDDGDVSSYRLFGFGPFIRYYYPLDNLYPFAEAELMFGTNKESYTDEPEKMLLFGLYAGAALPLGDRVTLDGMIGFSHVNWLYQEFEGEGTYKETAAGLAIRIGFSVFLR